MNTDYQTFRQSVRDFIADHYPAELRAKQDRGADLEREDFLAWHRLLAKQGWVAPSWPTEWGGPGWDKQQKLIFAEECALADTVEILPFGIDMLGPVVYTFGSHEQKNRFLPSILSGEDWWCQGYSEPGAGSDLAALGTRAERVGDHYIVNGQKTWTTFAHFANWGFFLVRTSHETRKQDGISFLLIDMRSPGVTVRPIITLGGEHDVNEVWLENVKVPVENLVGEEGKGWTCAKFLLAHERTGIAGVAKSCRDLEKLKRHLPTIGDASGKDLAEPFFRRKVSEVEIELKALQHTELRVLAQEVKAGPGPESSMLKIKGTEIRQRIWELMFEAAGPYTAPYFRAPIGLRNDGHIGPEHTRRVASTYMNQRKLSIFGGSNEIQRNIISKAVLGL
ncbi:acyl-CoA dehydrogenase family protein [Blastomonas sp. UPD001]|uniref:acyl-CoA dehydrogenase family protein n=1 Tax=Blastomonas sp. UPD001 TaxID=2217673 RepID=UPI000E34F995|nr:acyl-CoA dehydrogenase family protein [Blastomonas sp. UPD001]